VSADGGQQRPVYLLRLRPESGLGVPEMVRLRRCLKALLRCYGLVCLSVEEKPGEVLTRENDQGGHETAADLQA
jgi:hypothetical protein